VKLQERIPMLRWSFWRMAAGMKNFNKTGQIGDGREAAAVRYVLANARSGDIADVIATIDRFAYTESFLVNIGDHKGLLLDEAVRRAAPRLALELGTYCGYGALRIAAAAPEATVCSIELSADNAENARAIWAHAGVTDRVHCIVGTIGDGGMTLDRLAAEHGFGPETLDFIFLDHDKDAYEADLTAIERLGWLRRKAIVVADNVRVPGAPEYRAFMRRQEGVAWRTVEHKTRGEYGSVVPDLVLESTYLGRDGG